jgi:hypothetical protein
LLNILKLEKVYAISPKENITPIKLLQKLDFQFSHSITPENSFEKLALFELAF